MPQPAPYNICSMTPKEQSVAMQRKDDVTPTEMLYMTYEGNFLSECSARVLRVEQPAEPASGGSTGGRMMYLTLDQTVLHAQGEGQPTDKGVLLAGSGENSSCDNNKATSRKYMSLDTVESSQRESPTTTTTLYS